MEGVVPRLLSDIPERVVGWILMNISTLNIS